MPENSKDRRLRDQRLLENLRQNDKAVRISLSGMLEDGPECTVVKQMLNQET